MSSTDIYFREDFQRVDSTELGGEWEGSGTLQIIDGNIRQTGSGGASVAGAGIEVASAGDGFDSDMAVGIEVAFSDDTSTRAVGIVLRAPTSTILQDGYWVELEVDTDVATLKIIKRTDGASTVATSVDVTDEMNQTSAGSYIDQYQRVSARVRDTADGVVVEAFLNDEEMPRLSATDNEYPQHKSNTYTGIRFYDNSTTEGYVMVNQFVMSAVLNEDDEYLYIQAGYWTLNKLVTTSRSLALRDSSSLSGDDDWKARVNIAQQEYFDYIGRPEWADETLTVILKASESSYELPPWVDSFDDVITMGSDVIRVVSEHQFREDVVQNDSTGRPWTFRRGGRGPSGGLLLLPYPIPSSDTSITIRVHFRPRWMIEDNDMPSVPQGEAHHLVWGAIHQYNLMDNDRTKLAASSQKWQSYLRAGRGNNRRRRRAGRIRRIRPGIRQTGLYSGYDGPTRYGQSR